MEEKPNSPPPSTPAQPNATGNSQNQVMDVKAPPPADPPKPPPAASPTVHNEPASTSPPNKPEKSDNKKNEVPQQTAKKPPKPAAKGVTAAIFATVIIVLGLGGLAVYAYLKTR